MRITRQSRRYKNLRTAASRCQACEGPRVTGPARDPDRLAVLAGDGIGPEINGDRIYNGALDNATGVGGMIEVAGDDLYRREPHAILETFLVYQQVAGLKGLSVRTLRALRRVRQRPWQRDTLLHKLGAAQLLELGPPAQGGAQQIEDWLRGLLGKKSA